MDNNMNNDKKNNVKNNLKNCFKCVALLLVILLPVAVFSALLLAVPGVYGQTFLGELAPKYELLNETNSPKVVVIGGSSVAFGLDSELLSKSIGRPVVNFGLYATLGTKLMLDLSKSGIGRGDIVILAPELDPQTLSLYFNAEAAWQGMDSDLSMLKFIAKENRTEMIGGLYDYLTAKAKYTLNGSPNPKGVYNRDSFNSYGDIVYERPYNTMLLGYDPNKMIELTGDIFAEDFIDYVNDYIDWCSGQGATVYFSFCPMNQSAVSADTTTESELLFYRFLHDNLKAPVISNVNEYIMNENYFYDSNFHLNDAGVVVHTAHLAQDINRMLGQTYALDIELPEAPDRPIDDSQVAETDALLASYYTYEPYATGWMITGVTEEGRKFSSLELPKSYDGKAVVAIGAGAFDGCEKLVKLTIDTNIVQLMDGAFSGAKKLKKVYVLQPDPDTLGVGSDLFTGAADGVKIVLTSQEVYENYVTNYFWSKYGEWIVLETGR